MLSYRHSYHAGNHADVLKHIALVLLLQALKRKEKPLFYLDTHAGRGMYSLSSPEAQKLGEFKEGVLPFWEHPERLSEAALPYLALLRELNPSGSLKRYPGSPSIADHFLDPTDRMVLSELHTNDFKKLAEYHADNKRIIVECKDGLKQISTYLPPVERRGLIFVDPSYEIKSDYTDVPNAIWEGYKRFATGVFCIWYPLVKSGLHQELLESLSRGPKHEHFNIELKKKDSHAQSMYGSGLYIINPPWGIEEQLKEIAKAFIVA